VYPTFSGTASAVAAVLFLNENILLLLFLALYPLLLKFTLLKDPTAAPTVCTIVIIELPISPVTIRLARNGMSATITAKRMLASDINSAVLAP
jgi:hypothetical protein